MTNDEFIEKLNIILEKVGDAIGDDEYMDYIIVSSDPDCDADIGIDENGFLTIRRKKTYLSVSDVIAIKYRARLDESSTIDGYVRFICKDNIEARFDLDNFFKCTEITIDGRTFYQSACDIITSKDFNGEKDFWLNNKGDEILFYRDQGNSKKVIIPEGVVKIAPHAFQGAAIEELVTSNTLKCIGSWAFENCKSLKKIDLKMVEEIDNWAFYKCDSLCGKIEIPSSMRKISEKAFPSNLSGEDFINHSSIDIFKCLG